jgi:hypothetical protein
MAGKSVSRVEFIIGTAITILTILVGIYNTYRQIDAQSQEKNYEHTKEVFDKLHIDIISVKEQLDNHNDLYVEIESCLESSKNEVEARQCLHANNNFDPRASNIAWYKLDASIAGASLIKRQDIKNILEKLGDMKNLYNQKLNPILIPKTSAEAKIASLTILSIKSSLDELMHQLNEKLSQ